MSEAETAAGLRAVGLDRPRVDGPAKVTGSIAWTGNIVLPGMLRAKVLRSPFPHARILRIDASRAAAVPGVAAVLTRADLEGSDPHFGSVIRDQPVVAVDIARHVGDPVAAVAAETVAIAEAAIDLIDVDYEPLPPILDPIAAMAPDSLLVHSQERERPGHFKDPNLYDYRIGKSNVLMTYHVEEGDVDAAFQQADVVVEGTYTTPVVQHGHMEPHAATAHWDPAGRLVVHTPSQNPWVVRDQLASLFDLPGSHVRIVVPPIGGAYGAKTHARLEPIVAWLARLARRPVQLVLTREEVFATAVRHASVVRIRTGVRRDGTLVAREVESIYDTGAYAHTGPMTTKSGGVVSTGPYRIGHQRIRSHCVYTNKPPAGPYRGFGVSQVCWAYEQQMDEIADALGIDPLEIRRRNLIADGDTFVTGQPFVSVGIAECLDGVATAVDWGTPSETVDPDVVRGKGLAVSIKTTMTPSNSAASVRLNADGSAVLLISSAEMGQGVQTSMGQIVGEVLGIDPERVIVSLPDTDVTPFDSSTSSSRTIFSMGNAARLAAAEIRDELLGLAVDLLEAAVDDIELRDGRAFVHGAQAQAVPYSALFKKKFGMPVGSLFGSFDYQTVGGLDHATGKGRATSFFFLGACAAEVEVDVPTGRVTVLRIATSADVGKAITPVQCHLQNEGSMIMALGTALFEEMVFDNGQPINSTFLDYTIPSLEDHPREFRSLLVEHPHPDGPFGAKGAGEAVMPAIAPAIANAVSQALGGVRVNAMPLMPHVVRAAIEAHQQDRG